MVSCPSLLLGVLLLKLMARIQIPTTDITRSGVTLSTQVNADVSNNHYITSNDGRLFIEAYNNDVTSRDVTIQTPIQVDGLDVIDLIVSLSVGQTKLIGPFPTGTFNQTGSTNFAELYVDASIGSSNAELKFRSYRLP